MDELHLWGDRKRELELHIVEMEKKIQQLEEEDKPKMRKIQQQQQKIIELEKKLQRQQQPVSSGKFIFMCKFLIFLSGFNSLLRRIM